MASTRGVALVDERQGPSIKVTKRTDRSLYMLVLQHLIKPFNARLVKPKKETLAGSQQLEAHKKAWKHCDISERQVEGTWVYDMVAKEQSRSSPAEKRRRRRVYYFAGGGWAMPPSSEHWVLCAELARKLPDTVISIVSYPLAPNSPAPVAIPSLMVWYQTALREAEEADETVVFAGDSAGGNIALCLPLAALLEDDNARCPTAIMAISPSTDLSRSNPDIKAIEKSDPLLRIPFIKGTAENWRAEWGSTDPRISPLYADVIPLARRGVKVYGVVGRYDILSPDAILFREKCNQASVQGEWLDWEKQMHCFPLTWAFKLPEGVAAKDWIIDVLRRT
jgi:acetyl esterase/lipase